MTTRLFNVDHMLQQVRKVPVAWIANGLFMLCLVLILYQSSYLTWSVFTSPSELALDIAHRGSLKQPDTLSIMNLEKLYLFGKPVEEPLEQVVPTTARSSLNLAVVGIQMSNNPKDCIAVIRDDEGQSSYGVGDILPGGSEVISILRDRVIIRHRGIQEVLILETSEPLVAPIQKSEKQSYPPSSTPKLPMDKIIDNPERIFDYVNIIPKNEDGILVGYELHPGTNKEWFDNSGLQDGDLAIAINGSDLTDDKKMIEAMQQLPNLSSANVTVKRDGEEVAISVALN